MKPHKAALVHYVGSEWARAIQHRTNQFSQLKIQGSELIMHAKGWGLLDEEEFDPSPKKIILYRDQYVKVIG